jgi:hypothetical protein
MEDILTVVLTANADFTVGSMGDDGAVVMDKTTGDCFELNRTAASVWKGLQSGQTGRDVLVALTAAYKVPSAQIEADLRALLADFLQRRMLVAKPEAKRDGT